MEIKLMTFSSIVFSTMFLFTSHPVSMMLVIITQTFMLCLMMWSFLSISWFSYIMFLIYLGGLMVLFIYMSSLAYNEKFKVLNHEAFTQTIFISIMTIPLIYIFFEEKNIKEMKMEVTEFIFKIYSASSTFITSMTIIYLIITLIVVVKMTTQFYGPLRSKN